MDSISTFDIKKEALLDLLYDIKQGFVQLADFQRDWCWDDSHVKRLLACVSLGFPVGVIMLLEQGNPYIRFQPRLVSGVALENAPDPKKLILEGQQRLTALFMTLLSQQPVILQGKQQKLIQRWYYIDIVKALQYSSTRRCDAILGLSAERLLRKGQLIDCSTPEKEYQSDLFPLAQVFNFSQWRSEYSKYWNYRADKLTLIEQFETKIIKKFEYYQMPVIVLRSELPKEGVCQIFEETNKAPCILTYFDLMTASYAAEEFTLREDWGRREQNLKPFKVLRLLKNTDFLQTVTLVSNYASRIEAINSGYRLDQLPGIGCSRQDVLRLSLAEYKTWADRVTDGYIEAARFLHAQALFDATDIPYFTQIVALAAILTILGEQAISDRVRNQLKRWYYSAVFGEMYTGWHESRAARDVVEVCAWLNGGALPSTIVEANLTVERLLNLSRSNGAAYRGINTLLRCCGAVDLSTGESITNARYFEEKIELHHIFPQSWCQKQGIEAKQYNSIINKTLLTAKTNKILGGKAPSVYLSKLETSGTSNQRLDEMLRTHLINPESLRSDDFETFFNDRTQMLMDLIGQAMGKCLTAHFFEQTNQENDDTRN